MSLQTYEQTRTIFPPRYNNMKNETTIGDMKSLQSIKVNDKFKKMGFPIPCLKMNCRFCVHSMLTSPMLYTMP